MRAGLYKYLNDNMLKRFRFVFICVCMMTFGHAGGLLHAQVELPRTLEVGPHAGLSYMIGDINPARHFAQPSLQYGAMLRYNPNLRWAFRLEYTHATLKASDEVIKWRPERGLNVKTVLNDLSVLAEFNFFEYYTGKRNKSFSPYLFGGFSMFQYAPYTIVGDNGINLHNVFVPQDSPSVDPTEAPPEDTTMWNRMFGQSSPFGMSLVFGFGVKMSLSKHLCMTMEWRMHKTFTDYLDDVSGLYPAEHSMVTVDGVEYDLTDPTGNYQPGQQRGDSAHDDWFGIVGISLSWRFNLPGNDVCKMMR